MLAHGNGKVRHLLAAHGDTLGVDVEAVDMRRKLAQPPDEGADAASDIQYPLVVQIHVTPDEGETALQPPRPDLAWVAQCRSFIS